MQYLIATVVVLGAGLLATSFMSTANLASVFSATGAAATACSDALIAAHGQALTKEDIVLLRTNITTSGESDHIAQLTSDTFCGTNGCVFEICTRAADGTTELINFGYAGTSLKPASTNNEGKFDLILNDEFRLTWSNGQYTIVD